MTTTIKRNRQPITDPRILKLIKECVDNTRAMGYSIPTELKFLQCKANTRAGLASYREAAIVLSTFIYEEPITSIKSTIYHELGHIIAGRYAKHGPLWKQVVNNISARTGIKITRCWGKDQYPKQWEQRQEKKRECKYEFRCKTCGSMLHYNRMSKFIRTYDEILPSGKPHWTCRRCGGTFERIK